MKPDNLAEKRAKYQDGLHKTLKTLVKSLVAGLSSDLKPIFALILLKGRPKAEYQLLGM